MLHSIHKSKELQIWNAKLLWFRASMKKDIIKRTERCVPCQTNKQQKVQHQPQLPIDTMKFSPGKCVQVDLYELDKTDYITVVDNAIGLIWSQKLANKEAGTTVKALENIFLKISMPFMIQTDTGKNFCSREFEKFAKKNNRDCKVCPVPPSRQQAS